MIRLKQVLAQIKWDLIGKDSHRGISLTYAWMCNQWGHIALGFVPALCMGAWGNMHWFGLPNTVIAGLLISVIATLFEIYNFTVPLFSSKSETVFTPAWRNIGFDTFTDLIFFYIGGLWGITVISAYTGQEVELGYKYALSICILFAVIVFPYWYTMKMYLQSANFPFQKRLSQWQFSLTDANKNLITTFVKSHLPQHMLIFGGEDSGKTSLAVAMATEVAIKRNPAYYSTACKMSEMFLVDDNVLKDRNHELWSWRQAHCLVIDDINSGTPVPDIIAPSFLRPMIFSNLSTLNCESLCKQSVIWVVGEPDSKSDWIQLLKDIGVAEPDIITVNLD